MKKLISASLMLLCLLAISGNSNADIGTRYCIPTTSAQYVPSKGYADIGFDGVSRYVIQYMYWRTSARLSFFKTDPRSTYEPDAIFYNYDGKAYGNAPIGYWYSDLPSPYVDTQFSDGPNEKAVTIGSAAASNINPGRFYITKTRMTSGGGTSSRVKLSSQRGIRDPSSCYTTNCSFGCNQNSNYFTVPFQSGYTAPGARVYWWLDPTTRDERYTGTQ